MPSSQLPAPDELPPIPTVERAALRFTFGDRLRKVRRAMGWTGPQMASLLGVSIASYTNWEAGRNQPNDLMGTAEDIAARLDIDLAWLLGLEDYGPRTEGHAVRRAEADRTSPWKCDACGFGGEMCLCGLGGAWAEAPAGPDKPLVDGMAMAPV